MKDLSSVPASPAATSSSGDAATSVPVLSLSALVAAYPAAPPQGYAGGPVQRRNPLVAAWRKIGGGSLALSILIHVGILLVGGLVVFTTAIQDKGVDFLPGGGSQKGADASQALSHQVQQKKRNSLKKSVPKQRLVSTSLNAAISLPDAPADILDMPDVSSMFGSGASMGKGMGVAGAGFGKGGMSGMTFQPITMFGKEIKDARKIAVVMDVSRSMTGYLPSVVAELDKIARQSVLVLYFGCGLSKTKGRVDDKVRKAEGEVFASFWQNWEGTAAVNLTAEERKKLKYDPAKPMPLEKIYQKLAGRGGTFFIDFNGIGHTQSALMSNEVMEADTIYWFTDFQDAVDEATMADVKRKLKGRKQKLYIHASTRGRSFDQVREALVLPLGGEVIEAEVKK